MLRRVLPLELMLIVLLASCVTVNVYFPAAAAERAADQIIDSVTGTSGATPQQAPRPQSNATQPPTGFAPSATERSFVVATLGFVLERLVPAAQAQASANLDISSPEIRAVTASMQQRFAQLEKYFAAGVIGLTQDGLVEIRDANAVPLAERATVSRLVAADNADRATLYAEIAKANGHPEWEADIRRTFARRWVERGAKPGWYYQDSSGNWVQK